jgi:predicted nucleic acid-binding protein
VARTTKRRVVMIILDSNIIIYLSKNKLLLDDIFQDENKRYAISVITYMEILGYDFENIQEENIIKAIINQLDVIFIDKETADKVVQLKKRYKIKLPDAIICATAITTNATLITNDKRLKTIEDLNLIIKSYTLR